MNSQPPRTYIRVAVAIVVAAVIIAAAILATSAVTTSTKTTTATYVTTYTKTTTASLATQPLSSSGFIGISNGSSFRSFYYVQWNSSTPNTFTIANVRFTLWTNTTISYTGGSCYGATNGYGGYVITFPDGSTERMTTCTVGFNPPTTIRLTSHINPQAGLFIFPSTGAMYFLVST